MAEKIAFDLVSPERLVLSQDADMVTVPGAEGYMGVMAGHAPLISTLRTGMVDMLVGTEETRFFIHGGFAEISAGKITVLAEDAVPMSDMDIAALDQRIANAQDDLISAKGEDERARCALILEDLKLVRAAF